MSGMGKSGRRLGGGCSIASLIATILMAAGGCHDRDTHGGGQLPGKHDAGVSDTGAGGDAPCPADPSRICEPDGWCWKNPLPQGGDLFAVWVPASGEIWGALEGGLLHRSAGNAWTKLVLNAELINGFWGAGSRDVWAVGRADISTGVILRWDGQRWTEVDRRAVPWGFTDVDGTSATDVWAVGGGSVVHFDGAAWAAVDVSGVLPSGAVGDMRVAAAAAGDVWVAVDRRLLHWNGASWSFEDLSVFITDVWADGSNVYRAVTLSLAGTAEIQRWNGSRAAAPATSGRSTRRARPITSMARAGPSSPRARCLTRWTCGRIPRVPRSWSAGTGRTGSS
jgi:hypothetical protein